MTFDHRLGGCVPSVLASYLKALAVHRLVTEQRDAAARSYWDRDDLFHLVTALDEAALVDFLALTYRPTPIVTPWNGGSGFYPGDQKAGIDAVRQSSDERFSSYRETLAACDALLKRLGFAEKPDKDRKLNLLRQCRAWLPDACLPWLDAAYAVAEEARYPALLGTGGNDGRLDFANNFMQRLAELFLSPPTRHADPRRRLVAALLHRPSKGVLDKVSVGQFAPGAAGGANMTTGFGADGQVNPWDFVLALEGALAFAGAAVRRMESEARGSASFPFHVQASAVGYGSAADSDEAAARSELWLPLWPQPTTFSELRLLFAEGRLDLGRRRAHSGLEAVQALASLGVDRGVDRFQRIGILRRNGLSFLASALGTFEVRQEAGVELLRDLGDFVDTCSRLSRPPEAVSRALRRLRGAIFDVSRKQLGLVEVLAAAGALEKAVGSSPKAREGIRRPLSGLSPAWTTAADDGSAEFALAAALASLKGWRGAIEPVDERGRWVEARPLWTRANPLENVAAIARRFLAVSDDVPFAGQSRVSAEALAALLDGRVGHERLTDLVYGLALVQPAAPRWSGEHLDTWPDTAFAVLRAVTSPYILRECQGAGASGRHPAVKVVAAIFARIAARDLSGAVTHAARRLTASGLRLKAPVQPTSERRDFAALATSLAVPLPRHLEEQIVRRTVALPDDKPAGQSRRLE